MIEIFYLTAGIVVLIILLVQEDKKNKNLEEKVRQLEKKLKSEQNEINEKNIVEQSEEIIQNNSSNIQQENTIPIAPMTFNNKVKKVNTSIDNVNTTKSKIYKQNIDDIKNNAILITGSIFIVLAAIIFLTSTWRIIPSIVKTLTLVTLVGVFLGASYIAKNVFKLKQTSKAFYFIAMAYIPICLISISVFGLLGRYLSIAGKGKYVYLTIISAIMSLIYYTEYYRNKYKSMYVLNLISQVFCVLFIMFIFKASAVNTCLAVIIYNLALVFIAKDMITNIISKIILALFGILSVFIDLVNGITWTMPIILLISIATLYFYSIREKKYKKNYLSFIVVLLIFTGYSIMVKLQLPYYAYAFYALLIFGISYFKKLKNKDIIIELKVIGSILIIFTYLALIIFNFSVFINNIILFVLLLATWLYASIIEKDKELKIMYKAFSVISLYLLLISISYFLDVKVIRLYIPTIATLILLFIEVGFEKYRNLSSTIMISISEAIAFFTLAISMATFAVPVTIVLALCILFINNFIVKRHSAFDLIPMIGLWIQLISFTSKVIPNEVFLGIIALITLVVSMSKNKLSVYTGISAFYLLSTFAFIKNAYINSILFIMWNSINCFTIENSKVKDIFKFLTITGIAYLYAIIMGDFIKGYNSFKNIIWPVYILIISRMILKKYVKNTSPIEICFLSLANLCALVSYKNEVDGMIYVLGIITLLVYSYNKKISSVFIVELISLIINVLVLTREFWLSIPWWLYMLVIGIVLISFAIYNEQNKENGKNIIEKIKKKLLFKS